MTKQSFHPATDVEQIVRDLIDAHHRHLEDESLVRVMSVFAEKSKIKGGNAVMAWTRAMQPMEVYLLGEEAEAFDGQWFLITVAMESWAVLEDKQREALIDHELCHIAYDDERESYTLRGHDVEEFAVIIQRHGLWKHDLNEFGREVAEHVNVSARA